MSWNFFWDDFPADLAAGTAPTTTETEGPESSLGGAWSLAGLDWRAEIATRWTLRATSVSGGTNSSEVIERTTPQGRGFYQGRPNETTCVTDHENFFIGPGYELDLTDQGMTAFLEREMDYFPGWSESKTTDTAIVQGGNQTDWLWGGINNDRLYGNGGDDDLRAGAGDDTVDGGEGDDVIYGGTGSDTLSGGDGDDRFYGNPDGSDEIDGGDGSDTVYCGDEGYTVKSLQNVEKVVGGAGIDDITLKNFKTAMTFTAGSGDRLRMPSGNGSGNKTQTIDLANGVRDAFTVDYSDSSPPVDPGSGGASGEILPELQLDKVSVKADLGDIVYVEVGASSATFAYQRVEGGWQVYSGYLAPAT